MGQKQLHIHKEQSSFCLVVHLTSRICLLSVDSKLHYSLLYRHLFTKWCTHRKKVRKTKKFTSSRRSHID